ncbi:MAG: riboflavin synthase [Actinomycetota bacterium]|nr:riboflavin synthase [Actinomycetota bacterium]
MFTGIVEELGEVLRLEPGPDSARITVRGPAVTADARRGGSIAVNGICLTVVENGPDWFTADVMLETLHRTSLGTLTQEARGARVNLERPVPVDGRLAGHIVQGHVDGTGTVLERIPGERWELLRISLPDTLARYVVEKGSIAVDGVSLTVVGVVSPPAPAAGSFTVSLIPETLRMTTLGLRAVGEPVNLEVDILAKHVERLMADRPDPNGSAAAEAGTR